MSEVVVAQKRKNKMALEQLNKIIAAPITGKRLTLAYGQDAVSVDGAEVYAWKDNNWNFIPEERLAGVKRWETWNQLQENGVASYQNDPVNNLATGKRKDFLQFGEFCQFDGKVLDVGCGPQKWPGYFLEQSEQVQFIGVDPLIGASSDQYTQVRALGEFLPFVDACMDQVIFATSIDHFVDPEQTLREAKRVCKAGGAISVWIGEKSPDAPKPAVQPKWYSSLITPADAQDPFHFKRLLAEDVETFFTNVGLRVVRYETHEVDAYRRNLFYRLER